MLMLIMLILISLCLSIHSIISPLFLIIIIIINTSLLMADIHSSFKLSNLRYINRLNSIL